MIATELSGETAKRNLEFIAREHRMRGSKGWHRAGQHVIDQLQAYGFDDAHFERFPADGKIFYGTQRSRPPWEAEFAELWNLRQDSAGWVRQVRLASWDAMPVTLAQDSESGEVTADLVDVGDGTAESDYAGKDVRGKLVLAAQQPGPVARLAVARFGAAGIVSYAQNQRSAWWGEDENLVRWGHLEAFTPTKTFAFMVSLKQARAFQQRLARGEPVRLEAKVKAGQHPGDYELVTATIPGADPRFRSEEIVYSCHLDHQRPGANDNASGCVTILEVARTLTKLIGDGRLPRPARTIRFVWPPEIEGTLALLTTRPELTARMKAVVHLDMVGGGPETKAIFHVTRGPASLPSFVYDVGGAFGAFVNRQSRAFAESGMAEYPLVAPEGGKEALQAELTELTLGSDHEVYTQGSFGIPAIYLNDDPDRYIHTNFDTPGNIDPTKLKRSGFIAAASGYYLANLGPSDAPALLDLVRSAAVRRTATMLTRRAVLPAAEAANLTRFHLAYERAVVASLDRFITVTVAMHRESEAFLGNLERLVGGATPPQLGGAGGGEVYRRNPDLKGPMSVFAYDYLSDHYGEAKAAALGLNQYSGLRGSGGDYVYEVLNLVDGRRTVREVRDAVSAIYGPVPPEAVAEYLRALESVGVVLPAAGR
ncbi:MAG TPA: M28 family peptidase [Gemmatimonadales bacterium]